MYKPLREAAALLAGQAKNLEQSLPGSQYLEPGKVYDVKIMSLDLSAMQTQGRFLLQVEHESGAFLDQSVWMMDKSQPSRFGRQIESLLTALFLQEQSLAALADGLMNLGDPAMNSLRGLSLRVLVGWGSGVTTRSTPDGRVVLIDARSGDRATRDDYNSVAEAREAAKRARFKRAFTQITSFSPVSPEVCDANWAAFNSALTALREIRAASMAPAGPASAASEAPVRGGIGAQDVGTVSADDQEGSLRD